MSISNEDALAQWAQWAFSFPMSESPFYHWNTKFGDGKNQPGLDFFCLTCTGGRGNNKNIEERDFDISKITKKEFIGIPILVAAYTKEEVAGNISHLDYARDIVKSAGHKELVIDGQHESDFDKYYIEIPSTPINLPSGHVADNPLLKPDSYDYAVAGYFAVKPTPKKDTRITFGGGSSKYGFVTSVDYTIKV